MSDTNSPSPQAPIPAPQVSIPAYSLDSIRDEASSVLKSSQNTVRERLITGLVEAELANRVKILQDGFARRDTASKDLSAIRPDNISYAQDGSKLQEGWSQPQLKKRNEAVQKLTKIDGAISKALNEANFEELKKIVSSKPDAPAETPSATNNA